MDTKDNASLPSGFYGPLEPFIVQEDVTSVVVCGPDKIFTEVNGEYQFTNVKFHNEAHLDDFVQKIVASVGRKLDKSKPICDIILQDGNRVAIIIPPVAIGGTTMTIKKSMAQPVN